jgi:hypothetical protein
MLPRLAVALLATIALRGCLTYEYEHEIWLQVNGSGTVNVTGRPALWTALKGLPLDESDPDAMKKAARELFEGSGSGGSRSREGAATPISSSRRTSRT